MSSRFLKRFWTSSFKIQSSRKFRSTPILRSPQIQYSFVLLFFNDFFRTFYHFKLLGLKNFVTSRILNSRCFDMLHVSRALADHLKIPISEKPIQLPKCLRHSYNTAEFACKDPECYHTSKHICHTCLLSDHKNHSYDFLMDVLERNQERLLNNQQILEVKYQNLKEKLEELRHSAVTYDTESPFYAEQIQVITDYFEARKMAALQNFDGFINEKRRDLTEKAEQMEYDLEMLKSVKKEVDTVLKTKKNLQNTDELVERGQAVASTVTDSSGR